ncbi:MAG: glucosamine--fructose-6-phosphate aminotransferase (isomerizing) [Parvicella sp.]|jgi:glucosamine--fructose-6-phosphate aminotransferase (isomerizing)
MCGIVAHVGKFNSIEIILNGLQRLEYRGYDSAGLATLSEKGISLFKKEGKVSGLKKLVDEQLKSKTHLIGIGHTRWATHGIPNDVNAHPHLSKNGKLAIIHNGIVENYDTLKKELFKFNYQFKSDTDTEVLINFIQLIQDQEQCSLQDAVIFALRRVTGAYAIVILDTEHPDTLIAARKGSPMVLGVGEDYHIIASDATPIIEYTNQVVYLNNEEIAVVKADSHEIYSIDKKVQRAQIQEIDLDLEAIEKGGFDYFMEKEIFEQPESVKNTMRGRVRIDTNELVLGGIHKYANTLIQAKKSPC